MGTNKIRSSDESALSADESYYWADGTWNRTFRVVTLHIHFTFKKHDIVIHEKLLRAELSNRPDQ